MLPPEVAERACRLLTLRSDALVLDVVADSDLERSGLFSAPRRLRFERDATRLDALVHDGDTDGLQVVLRLSPPARCVVRAGSLGHELAVLSSPTRTDAAGVARLLGLPRGLTSFELETGGARGALRTAWIRL
jgi:hypothetical protein